MMKKSTQVKTKKLQISAQKLRLVADLVRGKDLSEAMEILTFVNKKGAKLLLKSLKSAAANMDQLYGLTPDKVRVARLMIGEGRTAKRGRFVSRGRWRRIFKRTSQINLLVEEK